ncbi:MAG: hypothetical protein EOM91_13120 [Sphingobacteriia bacterium]|nr:hypothetical protein [Sphingobacteriia bacterium]NCC40188.1 hypothetical protein [Gammaproteobacteria bacterium]
MSNLPRRVMVIAVICLASVVSTGLRADTRSAMAEAMVRMMEAMGLFGGASGAMSSAPPGWTNPMGLSGWPAGFGAIPGLGMAGMPNPAGMADPMGQMSDLAQMDPTGQLGQLDPTGQMSRFAQDPTAQMGQIAGQLGQLDPTGQMNRFTQDPTAQMGQMMERFTAGTPMVGSLLTGASALDGIWEGNDEGLLIVQGGRYRIYAPFSGYVDGDIRVSGDRVELTNRREGFSQEFEYAQDQGRLVFRDRHGQLYLYRRLVLEEQR